MTDITVRFISNSFCLVNADEGVTEEIYDYFKFKDPSFTFRKWRKWDGNIRLFDKRTGKLPVGLIRYLIKFVKSNQYTIKISNQYNYTRDVDRGEINDYIKGLDLHDGTRSIEAYDYQQEIVKDVLTKGRVAAIAATSAGKSLISYILARRSIDEDNKMLIIVPSVQLVEQLYKDFIEYSTSNEFPVDEYVHKIYGGQDKQTDKPVTISTWQSLQDLKSSEFEKYDFLIVDECHTAQAKEINRIVNASKNARFRLGMTGTFNDDAIQKIKVEGLFAPSKRYVSSKELIDSGKASPVKIKAVIIEKDEAEIKEVFRGFRKKIREVVKHNESLEKGEKRLPKPSLYALEIDYLCKHQPRNELIARLAERATGNIVVFYQYVEKHGDVLYELMKKTSKKKVFYISGKVKVEEREDIRQALEAEEDIILIASYGTTSAGWSVKNIHQGIYGSPFKGQIRTGQTIGRGMRLHDSKESFILYDLVDDMRYGKFENYAMKHFYKRMNYYRDEEHDVEMMKIKL